jgi:hypothetical protein
MSKPHDRTGHRSGAAPPARALGVHVAGGALSGAVSVRTELGTQVRARATCPVGRSGLRDAVARLVQELAAGAGPVDLVVIGVPDGDVHHDARVMSPAPPLGPVIGPDLKSALMPAGFLAMDSGLFVAHCASRLGHPFHITTCRVTGVEPLVKALASELSAPLRLEPVPAAILRTALGDFPESLDDPVRLRVVVGTHYAVGFVMDGPVAAAWRTSPEYAPGLRDGPVRELVRSLREFARVRFQLERLPLALQGSDAKLAQGLAGDAQGSDIVQVPGRLLDATAIAEGLALSGLDERRTGLDVSEIATVVPAAARFAHGAGRPERRVAALTWDLAWGLVALVLLSIAMGVHRSRLESAADRIDRKGDAASADRAALTTEELVRRRDALAELAAEHVEFVSRPIPWSAALVNLAQAMPDSSYLLSIELRNAGDQPSGGASAGEHSLVLRTPEQFLVREAFLADDLLRSAFSNVDVTRRDPGAPGAEPEFLLVARGSGAPAEAAGGESPTPSIRTGPAASPARSGAAPGPSGRTP